MRILFYQHQYPAFGGIETVTTLLALQFVADGHSVRIVSFQARPGTTLLDELPIGTWHRLPSEIIMAKDNLEALCRELKTFSPNVILFQDSYGPIEDILFRAADTICPYVPIVLAEHTMPRAPFPHQLRFGGLRDILRDLAIVIGTPYLYGCRFRSLRLRRRKLHARAQAYVLLSRQYERAERYISGWRDRSQVYYIPNPVRPAREKPVVVANRKQILTVSSLIESKGVNRLLDIWAKVEVRFPEWSFVIVGDGAERANLEQYSRSLDLKNVCFKGFKKDPEPYYRESSIFVMASSYEGWPMVLGEAMQQGCAPVSYDSFASIYDIVDDNVSGRIIPHFHEPQFVSALDELMSDPARLVLLQRGAMEKAKEFSLRTIANRWYELFAQNPEEGSICRV